MVKVILVDDEPLALQRLRKLIEAHTDFQVAAAFSRATDALNAAATIAPNAAFLDIEMPGMNGLELANRLTEACPDLEIVMVTAFSEYALQAFRANAIDYLVKPVTPEDVVNCAKKLRRRSVAVAGSSAVQATDGEGVRIVGFGGFDVFASGLPLPVRFATAKCEELLAYLLANKDVTVSKWDMCEHIWPGQDLDKAEQNLHTCVYRLKKTLSEHRVPIRLESVRGGYRCVVACRCDFLEPELMSISHEEWNEDDIRLIEANVAHYRGPLFAGKAYAWAEPLREKLERRFCAVVKRLAAYHFAAGREERALGLLRSLTVAAPFDEEGYELLLGAYAGRGDRVAFMKLYRKLEQLFGSELGLAPGPGIRALYERMERES